MMKALGVMGHSFFVYASTEQDLGDVFVLLKIKVDIYRQLKGVL